MEYSERSGVAVVSGVSEEKWSSCCEWSNGREVEYLFPRARFARMPSMLTRTMSPPIGHPALAIVQLASAKVRTALIVQRNAYMQKTYVSWVWTHGLGLMG